MKQVKSTIISVLYPFAIKIELQLEIVMDKLKFSILRSARKLETFKVTMVELAVWIGQMDS